MKKSQRARLTVLAAKDVATLTAEEKAELTTLQGLASANPDATKDTDDAAPAAAAAAPTLTSVIKGALAGFGDKAKLGTDLAQARTELATRTSELAAANSEISNLKSQISDRDSQLGAFAAFFGVKPAELAGKSTADLAAILAQKISDSAIEQLASAGVPAAQLPKQTAATTGGASDKELSYEEFSKLSASAKMKFSLNGGRLTSLPLNN